MVRNGTRLATANRSRIMSQKIRPGPAVVDSVIFPLFKLDRHDYDARFSCWAYEEVSKLSLLGEPGPHGTGVVPNSPETLMYWNSVVLRSNRVGDVWVTFHKNFGNTGDHLSWTWSTDP